MFSRLSFKFQILKIEDGGRHLEKSKNRHISAARRNGDLNVKLCLLFTQKRHTLAELLFFDYFDVLSSKFVRSLGCEREQEPNKQWMCEVTHAW